MINLRKKVEEMESKEKQKKEEIANMIQKEIAKCHGLVAFWVHETDPSENKIHIENLKEYLCDESLREICLNMLHQQ